MGRLLLALVVSLSVACASVRPDPVYPIRPDPDRLPEAMADLARRAIEDYHDPDRGTYLDTLFRLQMVAGDHAGAIRSLQALRERRRASDPAGSAVRHLQYETYSRARLRQAEQGGSFASAFSEEIAGAFGRLDDRAAFDLALSLGYSLPPARREFRETLDRHEEGGQVSLPETIALLRRYLPLAVYEEILPLVPAAIEADDARRYMIEDDHLITTPDGASLSALVVRSRSGPDRQPAALMFNIYTDPATNLLVAKNAAARGYTGVVADPRGKRLSPDEIFPYEHEASDTVRVIDWISEQPWSDGRVSMYGGSYGGFSAWAATKQGHPALKTIVAWVASIPGLGLPMHNNVFTNANYCWAHQVTQDRLDAPEVCRDRERWDGMVERWYGSGRPYREIDQVDGTPNRLLQRWLDHPDYDAYWQAMVPFGDDFARIDIPVLSLTGYFDDAQISALHYVREHYRNNPDADHYLVIGPYDHFTAQWKSPPVLRGYRLDPVAALDTYDLTFAWLDHVLKGGPKPAILKDRINLQVMGANVWRHVGSLEAAGDETLVLYLSEAQEGGRRLLAGTKPAKPEAVRQEIDFADRTTMSNDDFYPDPVIRKSLDPGTGLVFVSEPLDSPIEVLGAFGGVLRVTLNKTDVDLGVTLYGLTPEGEYVYLSWWLGRASYAKDMTTRDLLTPGEVEEIPIRRSYMTGRRLEMGSRIVAVVDVNKNAFHEVNHGTGGTVSEESIRDAGAPLEILWHNDSRLEIPIARRQRADLAHSDAFRRWRAFGIPKRGSDRLGVPAFPVPTFVWPGTGDGSGGWRWAENCSGPQGGWSA